MVVSARTRRENNGGIGETSFLLFIEIKHPCLSGAASLPALNSVRQVIGVPRSAFLNVGLIARGVGSLLHAERGTCPLLRMRLGTIPTR